MSFDIEALGREATQAIASCSDLKELGTVKLKYLSKKGLVAQAMSAISSVPAEQKPAFGKAVNELKNKLWVLLQEKSTQLKSTTKEEEASIDVTMPGANYELGHKHILTKVLEDISDIFLKLGFRIIEGPEIETEFNNFTGLNIPLEHPSREAFDTFYIDAGDPKIKNKNLLLRSHTSPVQIRAMSKYKPPLAIIVPGRVYRPDAVDASHSFMFHQVEGFLVDKNITFADLKGVLEFFIKDFFGSDTKMRFRPHYFPFTEPSAEVDISCIICKGKGCSVCSRKGWLEILGCGMIHPNVLRAVKHDVKKYNGFAFGMGVERMAMLKYRINDIRLFFDNDLRFIKQF